MGLNVDNNTQQIEGIIKSHMYLKMSTPWQLVHLFISKKPFNELNDHEPCER